MRYNYYYYQYYEVVPVIMYGVDLSVIATGEVSMDPENLRFQYDMMEEAEPAPPKTSKRGKPQVYREQVCWRQKDNFWY